MVEKTPSPIPSEELRTAREVIDAAIRETRAWEWLCLTFTIVFAVVGVGLIILGAIRGDWGIAGPGVGTAALFGPTLWAAIKVWRTNIRIRLLEIPLSLAKTADEAAGIINEVFLGRASRRKSDGVL